MGEPLSEQHGSVFQTAEPRFDKRPFPSRFPAAVAVKDLKRPVVPRTLAVVVGGVDLLGSPVVRVAHAGGSYAGGDQKGRGPSGGDVEIGALWQTAKACSQDSAVGGLTWRNVFENCPVRRFTSRKTVRRCSAGRAFCGGTGTRGERAPRATTARNRRESASSTWCFSRRSATNTRLVTVVRVGNSRT